MVQPFSAGNSLIKDDVIEIVERYGEAWVSQSPEMLCELFCEDGIYFERPGKSIQGHEALGEYWKKTVVEKQANIEFRHIVEELLFDPENLACTAKWECKFDIMKPRQHTMNLITVAVIRFRKDSFGQYKVESMEEFWHNAQPRERGPKEAGQGQQKGQQKNKNRPNLNVQKSNQKPPQQQQKKFQKGNGKGKRNADAMEVDTPPQQNRRNQPKSKGKGKGNNKKGGGKGGDVDRTCWDFVKGNCKRGNACKWQH